MKGLLINERVNKKHEWSPICMHISDMQSLHATPCMSLNTIHSIPSLDMISSRAMKCNSGRESAGGVEENEVAGGQEECSVGEGEAI